MSQVIFFVWSEILSSLIEKFSIDVKSHNVTIENYITHTENTRREKERKGHLLQVFFCLFSKMLSACF